MTKLTASLTDGLFNAVDAEAARRGTTRGGFPVGSAEESLRHRTVHPAEQMAGIDVLDSPTPGRGGSGADLIKASRPEP